MSKILRMPIEGGVPEEITIPIINDNKTSFESYISNRFYNQEGGSGLDKVAFSDANNNYYGYYNSTAAEEDKTPIKLGGKSIYSDVYVFKENENGEPLGLSEGEINILKGHLSRG